jgi:hypothetical protein
MDSITTQTKKLVGLETQYVPLTSSFISRLKINHCGAQVITKNVYNAQKLTPNPPWSTGCGGDYPAGAILYLNLFLFEPQVTKQWFCSVAPTPKKSGQLYTDQRVKRKEARPTGCDLRA